MDPLTKSLIAAAADGPLAEMGFTGPIDVAEWWQYGLRYRNGLRAIDVVIDAEFGHIFVVLIRTLDSDRAKDLASLTNGLAIELATACRLSHIDYYWTPPVITSDQWHARLPDAIQYALSKVIELVGREGAWDKAIECVAEQRERDVAMVRSALRANRQGPRRASVAPPIEPTADQARQNTKVIEPAARDDHPAQRHTSRMPLIMGAIVVLITSLYSCSRENW